MLKGYLKIIRPANSVAAGLAVLLGVIIATGTIPPASLPLIAVVFLITGAGNVINDYCDSETDPTAPSPPVPSRKKALSSTAYFSSPQASQSACSQS